MIRQSAPPVATYRIQLNKDFTFQQLLPVVDYLNALGVSHIYLSPIFESTPGSNHGYDTVDFNRISAERGGEEGLRALDKKLQKLDLKMIVDIVPNHMGAHTDNPFWMDVLEKGRASQYWSLFDMRVDEKGRTQLPVLGGELAEALDRKNIKLGLDVQGRAAIAYGGKYFPLSDTSRNALQDEFRESGSKDFGSFLQQRTARNIETILGDQKYEFVHWEKVKESVSYRRFFDVNELIGVRVEDESIFNLTHGRLNELAGQLPSLDGVRVDHVDGLVDPKAYLHRLAESYDAVWIEKILGRGESIPEDWSVRGATGYEFVAFLNDLITDKSGFERISGDWRALTSAPWNDFFDAVRDGKIGALENLFPSELKRLARLSADDADGQMLAAIFWKGITVGLSVYRTYYDDEGFAEADRGRIMRASRHAEESFGANYQAAAQRFLPSLLDPATDKQKQAVREWQQLSGPTMAKGLEDTAHYNYTPLTALNEVGCEADLTPVDPQALLDWINRRGRSWGQAMNATSTHDTKRSEDVRARLYALSAMPEDWMAFVAQVIEINRPLHSPGPEEEYFLYQAILGTWPFDGVVTDDYRKRLAQYMTKDMKEAKRRTSWLHPDAAYEKSVLDFTNAVLHHPPFVAEMDKLARRVAPAGAMNALTVQTLKCLLPGMPDIYQGTEDWDFSLVDPDNRRPIDYGRRVEKLDRILTLDAKEGRANTLDTLTRDWRDGTIKQWLTRRLLQVRRDHLIPMGALSVATLDIHNAGGHLIGYRITGDKGGMLAVIAPRNSVAGREDSRLALPDLLLENLRVAGLDGSWRDLIAEADIGPEDIAQPAQLLRRFPVAILART